MGNSVSSTSAPSLLTQTSQLAVSIGPSATIPASPTTTLVSVVRTADGSLPSCGSSGSPCCVSPECSSTADSRYEPALTTSDYSPECTDEPSASAFTCVDWGCIYSVVEAAGSSLCPTNLPWIVTSTSTVYYYTDDCDSYYPEPTTSWHLFTSSHRPVVTTTVSYHHTLTTSSESSWPTTADDSCDSVDYDDPWDTCLLTLATMRHHHSTMTISSSSRYHHRSTTISTATTSTRSSRSHSHSFFTAKTPGTCHPPNCNGPPTESNAWPQTTMPATSGSAVAQSGGAEISGT
ncbi:hypothetical protein F5X99DRAFT_397542 [Biscogniauxia marginata]|nr:hypothetical protein F5X99DRAFT_397542 [Biscogniauxia marginata]